jgi:PAS domain S-box-containing protein
MAAPKKILSTRGSVRAKNSSARRLAEHPRTQTNASSAGLRVMPGSTARAARSNSEERLAQLELAQAVKDRHIQELKKQLLEAEVGRYEYESLFQDAPVGYAEVDDLGMIHRLNESLAVLLNINRADFWKISFSSFVEREDLHLFLAHLREGKTRRDQVRTDLHLHIQERGLIPVSLISLPSRAAGRRRLVRMVVVDNSTSAATQATLRRTQRDYRQLIDSVDGVVWEASAQTHEFSFVSKQAERLLGYPLERWTLEPYFWQQHIYVDDRERVLDTYARNVAARADFAVEYRFIAGDRRTVWLRDNVSIHDHNGRLRLRGVAVDMTDRKRVDELVQQSRQLLEQRVAERTRELQQSVAELQAFSYSLSHDMRGPLRAMHSFAELALQQCSEDIKPDGREFLRRIIASAERLDRLIHDVLRYSSIAHAPIELQKIDLQKLIARLIAENPVFRAPRARIEITDRLLPATGNEIFLTQCVTNLLSNATKFVAPGVVPHVRIGTQAIGRAAVQLWFQDNGVGISQEHQKRIFGIFEQVHRNAPFQSTGIGLAIVRRAVERMGGQVGVESIPGRGSRFWLQLKSAGVPMDFMVQKAEEEPAGKLTARG